MKITELQINDWVLYQDKPIQIQFIYNDGYDDNVAEVEELYSPNLNEIEPYLTKKEISIEAIDPIPLTPEILEKNGWKDKNNISDCLGIEVFADEKKLCGVEFCADDEYSFNTYERWEETDYDGAPTNWGYRYINTIYRLHYVHELQHALRLCGLNELADNFQI